MEIEPEHKVVFHLSNNDTFVQKSLIRQLAHVVQSMEKGLKVEVVTHGFGIDLLLRNSAFTSKVEELGKRGIQFLVCEKTISSEKLSAADFPGFVKTVPAGIAHIIRRQTEGWSYIKAGY